MTKEARTRLLDDVGGLMSACVVSVNISADKGTPKLPVPEILVNERGVVGDAHAGNWHRQVSLLSQEIILEFES
jgi:hypothetical protein